MSGVINAIISGGIQWYLVADHAPLPMTVDGITNDEHTVHGAAVPLAVILAMILTAIAYKTDKRPKPPFFPTGVWLTVKHGIFTLGIIVTFAMFWQRLLGSMFVSLPVAVVTFFSWRQGQSACRTRDTQSNSNIAMRALTRVNVLDI